MAKVPSRCFEKTFFFGQRTDVMSYFGELPVSEEARPKYKLKAQFIKQQHNSTCYWEAVCTLDHIKDVDFSCLLGNKMAKISRREKRKSAFFVCFWRNVSSKLVYNTSFNWNFFGYELLSLETLLNSYYTL